MYQHMWFNEQNYTEEITLKGEKPQDWIEDKDIIGIVPMCWCEHCLECAVPLCYNNCKNWIERIDKKCQKTYYGVKSVNVDGRLAAQLKFRKWGKIESPINSGFVSPLKHYKMYKQNINIENCVLWASNLIKHLSPTYKLCGAQHVFYDKYLKNKKTNNTPQEFLVQCYSPCEQEYNLLIEFYTPTGVFFRDSVRIKHGFNQKRFDISNVDLKIKEGSRARIYPENNIEEEIVFFYTDFVRIKEKTNNGLNKAEKVKCVAWDLDNTIWDGILIESDPNELKLKPSVLETIKALDKRGIIQIVVSKNDIENVEKELKRLEIYDWFVLIQANWEPKSENIKKAAKMLNINSNSFALIDDSPFERGEVSENLSCVRVFDENQINEILQLPEFDVPVTEDSKKRRIMYQTEAKRNIIHQSFSGSNIDFLKNCELVMKIEKICETDYLRSYELVQRTNQLNLSGIKYTKENFEKIIQQANGNAYTIKCSDKYGDYGQVGFFNVDVINSTVIIKEYVMSCRVASKWLEPALMQWLLNKYQCDTLVFDGINNQKNGLLIRTLQNFGLINTATKENKLYLEIKKEKMIWESVVAIVDKTK